MNARVNPRGLHYGASARFHPVSRTPSSHWVRATIRGALPEREFCSSNGALPSPCFRTVMSCRCHHSCKGETKNSGIVGNNFPPLSSKQQHARGVNLTTPRVLRPRSIRGNAPGVHAPIGAIPPEAGATRSYSSSSSSFISPEGTSDISEKEARGIDASTSTGDSPKQMPPQVHDLFHSIRRQSLGKLGEFSPGHLFSLVWAYATAKMLDPELMHAVSHRLDVLAEAKDRAIEVQRRQRQQQKQGQRQQQQQEKEKEHSSSSSEQGKWETGLEPKEEHKIRERSPTTAADVAAAADTSPVRILREGEHWACVLKPAGLQVNPPSDADIRDYSIMEMKSTSMQRLIHDQLGAQFPICTDPEASYGLVHRLDMDTTGNLLVAKTWRGYYWLRLQWSAFRVLKEYICLAHGHVQENFEIKDRIKVIRETNERNGHIASTAHIAPDGRPAHTEVFVLGHFTKARAAQGREEGNEDDNIAAGGEPVPFSLLRCRIHTGRTHQIRLHLSARGFPLVSDMKYGKDLYEQDKEFCQRNFLHNYRLGVDDVPDENGESIRQIFDAPLSDDLRAVLKSLTPEDEASKEVMDSLTSSGVLVE